jgi:arylsulfatase A-like enzyme
MKLNVSENVSAKMDRRRFLKYCAASGLAAGAARASEENGNKRPNIVLILADDLGAVDTSLGGSRLYPTPNLRRLAGRGMQFTNAYSASPLCSPTRASIMTGQNPARTGITNPSCHEAKVVLKPSAPEKSNPRYRQSAVQSANRLLTKHYTLAEALKDAGYATGHFGKWHLGRKPYTPLEHGFDVDVPHWYGPGPAGSFVAPWKYPSFRERYPKEHIEDRMGDEAVAFMEKNKDRPFFLNYWQFSVHAPFDAKAGLIKKYQKKIDPKNPQQSPTYAAMVHSLDDNVGKILDAIDRMGITDNTIIIFYSDNGGNMYNLVDGTTATSNAPFRGGKATMYEGGIRVPAIFVWPGVAKGGTKNQALIQSEDLYTTILEMAHVSAWAGQAVDSVSAVPALKGRDGQRKAVHVFFPHRPQVPDFLSPCAAVSEGAWKLIRIFHDGRDQRHRHELYNLKEDVGERYNVAAEHPERVRRMDAMIESFLMDTKAVVPVSNPDYNSRLVFEAGGWRSVGYVHLIHRWAGLQVRSFGEDLMMIETADELPVAPGRYVLEFRMRSLSASGPGRVYWAGTKRDFKESWSAEFSIADDGLWHEHRVNLPFAKSVRNLRLSPACSQGTVHFEWIRLRDSDGRLIKEWNFR